MGIDIGSAITTTDFGLLWSKASDQELLQLRKLSYEEDQRSALEQARVIFESIARRIGRPELAVAPTGVGFVNFLDEDASARQRQLDELRSLNDGEYISLVRRSVSFSHGHTLRAGSPAVISAQQALEHVCTAGFSRLFGNR